MLRIPFRNASERDRCIAGDSPIVRHGHKPYAVDPMKPGVALSWPTPGTQREEGKEGEDALYELRLRID